MDFKDYYQALGVERSATQEVIKRAYRKLARKYHPDVSKEPDAESRFKAVDEAHEALIDPERRAAYPAMLRRAMELGGFTRCYLISHAAEVWAQADAVIRVEGGRAWIER